MGKKYDKEVPFSSLVGETITKIDGMKDGSDKVTFYTKSGNVYHMYHEQDCCENVRLVDVYDCTYVGQYDDVDSTVSSAEKACSPPPFDFGDSMTWTFYHIKLGMGYISLRWVGESNGYYSESVEFFLETDEEPE